MLKSALDANPALVLALFPLSQWPMVKQWSAKVIALIAVHALVHAPSKQLLSNGVIHLFDSLLFQLMEQRTGKAGDYPRLSFFLSDFLTKIECS